MKTLRLVFLSLTLIACSVTPVRAGSATHARDAMAEGLAAYEAKDFERASQAFVKASELASGTRLDAAVAHYNEGNALLAADQPDEAAARFAEALRTTDLDLQERAFFNRGTALMAGATALEAQQMLDPAMEKVNEAATLYEQAMRLAPGDVDPKVNYELALKKLEDLERKKEEQQQQQGQDDQQQDPEQQDPEQQDQEQQGDQEQQQDQPQQDQPSGQQDQQEQEQNGNRQDPEQQPDAQQGAESEAEPMPSEEMTRDEAEMMLDAKREEEKAAREKVRMRLGSPQEVEKDW